MQNASNIAQLRQQIQTEYEAAQRGLSGLASGTTRHDFINARMERLGVLHEELSVLVGSESAISIMVNTIWTSADQGTISG